MGLGGVAHMNGAHAGDQVEFGPVRRLRNPLQVVPDKLVISGPTVLQGIRENQSG